MFSCNIPYCKFWIVIAIWNIRNIFLAILVKQSFVHTCFYGSFIRHLTVMISRIFIFEFKFHNCDMGDNE